MLGRVGNGLGPGSLAEGWHQILRTHVFSTVGAVVIHPKATVDFVYNALELPSVPLVQTYLSSLLLNL